MLCLIYYGRILRRHAVIDSFYFADIKPLPHEIMLLMGQFTAVITKDFQRYFVSVV